MYPFLFGARVFSLSESTTVLDGAKRKVSSVARPGKNRRNNSYVLY